jgi:NAD(P)-dependent dehydrogenase (short-subunit alcohol dehydrogenase family)
VKDFRDVAALVTGGASGIGYGIARALAARGARIAVADLDPSALDTATQELRASGATVIPLRLDVRDRTAWEPALDRVEAELGPLQILCSNAGVAGSHLPLAGTSWEGWSWTIDVNLHGTFHALRAGLPRMQRHGLPAHVVCTASLGAFLVGAGNAAYCATKAGVVAMCEALRRELEGTPIGVSVLLPGLVSTALLDNTRKLAPPTPIGGHGPEVEAGIKAGLDPLCVGELVVDGIRDARFWLFTHPELRALVGARGEEILAAM